MEGPYQTDITILTSKYQTSNYGGWMMFLRMEHVFAETLPVSMSLSL